MREYGAYGTQDASGLGAQPDVGWVRLRASGELIDDILAALEFGAIAVGPPPHHATARGVKFQKSLLSRRHRAFLPAPIGSIRPSSRMLASVFEM